MLDMVGAGSAYPANWDGRMRRWGRLVFVGCCDSLTPEEQRELESLNLMIGAMNTDEGRGGPARSFGREGKWE